MEYNPLLLLCIVYSIHLTQYVLDDNILPQSKQLR